MDYMLVACESLRPLTKKRSLVTIKLLYQTTLLLRNMVLHSTLPLTEQHASDTILSGYLFTPHTHQCSKRNSQ
jgi:hypothetical protein